MKHKFKHYIIGGTFGLGEIMEIKEYSPSFLKGRNILLANARSCISVLIELLKPAQVWMPSYLVYVMIDAVNRDITNLRFYEVNYDLAIPSLAWLDEVQQGDLIVFIDYFGFPCNSFLMTEAKKRRAWILDDASQALLSGGVGRFSDFVMFNPTKFLGIPDGGILCTNCKVELKDINLKRTPEKWWIKSLSATVLRREFDLYGGSRDWFRLFQEADVESPIGKYAMSSLSKMLLKYGFDYSAMAKKRIENYQTLAKQLNNFALFPNLPADVVPVGFPIRIKNRDTIRQSLFNEKIYPPVHWSIQKIIPAEFKESHKLSSEIMTLPCDQRYDCSDMQRVADCVLQNITKLSKI